MTSPTEETAPMGSLAERRVAIAVRDLGKSYRIYRKPEDRLKQALWRGRRRYFKEFWAIRGLSFDVPRGETLGIVGQNGSGKTTLLELISGTLEPSRGVCRVDGRVVALLELGTDFNAEFTGRENVYLSAAVAGMSREEIDARYSEIVSFADIGEFIDQPVKIYSNGMLLRLAFAVAVSVSPEILVIDEVLAVGDEASQRKCFARLECMQEQGATILLASHDPTTILSLCSSALLLDRGEMLLMDAPKTVIGSYHQLLFAPPEEKESLREGLRAGREITRREEAQDGARRSSGEAGPHPRYDPGLVPQSTVNYPSRGAEIEGPRITTATGERVNVLVRGEEYLYKYTVRFSETHRNVRFGMLLKTKAGFELGGGASAKKSEAIPLVREGTVIAVEFRFTCRLLPGVYFLNAGVTARVGEEETYVHRLVDAAVFRVRTEGELHETGIVDFGVTPTVRLATEHARVEEGRGEVSS